MNLFLNDRAGFEPAISDFLNSQFYPLHQGPALYILGGKTEKAFIKATQSG